MGDKKPKGKKSKQQSKKMGVAKGAATESTEIVNPKPAGKKSRGK